MIEEQEDMRIVVYGTPDFSAPRLRRWWKQDMMVAVVPADKPAAGKEMTDVRRSRRWNIRYPHQPNMKLQGTAFIEGAAGAGGGCVCRDCPWP